MRTINESIENCMDCKAHKVIADPDPTDRFNDDDEAVLCTLTNGNPFFEPSSRWHSEHQNMHRCITSMCRPHQKRHECEIPEWCPKLNHKTPQQKLDEDIATNLSAVEKDIKGMRIK